LTITPANLNDLNRYIDLLEENADWLRSRGVGKLAPGTYRGLFDYFSTSITRGEVHFCFINDEIAGTLRLLAEDHIIWPEAKGDALYLHNLIVRRAWRGRALGRQLLAWAEQHTRIAGKAFLRLDCFADNAILRKYYEDAGFVSGGEVMATYPFGALRMQRYEKRALST
jgi:GNAT superfamily N-acetyltransferase